MTQRRSIESGGYPGNGAAEAGRNVIVAIGVDRYHHRPRLSNAVRDACGAAALFEQLGFEQPIAPLLEDRATARAIWSLVTDDLVSLGEDDRLVLFYAGHGGTRRHRVGHEEIKTGYLIPVDAEDRVSTWVDLEGWLRAVALLPAKHILVILDACHSGIALDPVIKWRDNSTWRDEPLAALRARRSRRIITSALDDQLALDSGPLHGHSLFTGCLIEALTYGLRRGGDQVTTGSELGAYVQRRVETYPHSRQTPDFGTFAFDDRGEMVLSLMPGPQPATSPIPATPHDRPVPAVASAITVEMPVAITPLASPDALVTQPPPASWLEPAPAATVPAELPAFAIAGAAAGTLQDATRYNRLVVLSSNFAGMEFALHRPAMTIGRSDDNDIVLPHRSIKPRHAMMRVNDWGCRLEDSTERGTIGVIVNGQDYGKVDLRRGDIIDLGRVRLRFVDHDEDFVFARDAVITDVPVRRHSRRMLVAMSAIMIVLSAGAGIYLGIARGGNPDRHDGDSARSLYERLGKTEGIAAVVKDLVEQQIARDSRINGFFRNVDIPDLERKLTDQICQASGGPCAYTGKDMATAHTGMGIHDSEFSALLEDLKTSLERLHVAGREQQELLAGLGAMHDEIVTAP